MLSLGVIFAIISFLGWGVADFLAKRVVDKIGALWSLLIMQIIGIVPIVIYSLLFLKIPLLSLQMLGILALSSFLLIFAYLIFYKAIKYGPISIVSPIAASGSAITILISVLFFAEALTLAQALAIAVIFLGVVLVSVKWNKSSKKVFASYGALLALFTMLGWGFAFPLMKINMNVIGPVFTLLLVRFFSIVFLSIYSSRQNRPVIDNSKVWLYLITIGLVDAFAFLAYYIGVSMDYLSIISPVSSSYPAVTIILAYIFLKERVQNIQKIGIVLILLGLILISVI